MQQDEFFRQITTHLIYLLASTPLPTLVLSSHLLPTPPAAALWSLVQHSPCEPWPLFPEHLKLTDLALGLDSNTEIHSIISSNSMKYDPKYEHQNLRRNKLKHLGTFQMTFLFLEFLTEYLLPSHTVIECALELHLHKKKFPVSCGKLRTTYFALCVSSFSLKL